MLLLAKRFTNNSLPSISDNRVANPLADGQPQSRRIRMVASRFDDQHVVGCKGTTQIDVLEFPGSSQACRFGETFIGAIGIVRHGFIFPSL